MNDMILPSDYQNWLKTLKNRIQAAQQRAVLAVNQELLHLYWRTNVDRMLEFNEKAVLTDNGTISHDAMQKIAHERERGRRKGSGKGVSPLKSLFCEFLYFLPLCFASLPSQ